MAYPDSGIARGLVEAPAVSYTQANGTLTDLETALHAGELVASATAGTMEVGKALIPAAGGVVDALDVTTLKIGGQAATAATATALTHQTVERTFTETAGTGTYTGTVVVPAGATVVDVIWRNTVVWANAASASVVVGDDDDVNGYVEATNLKSAPAADTNGAAAGLSSRLSLGATIGVYKGGAGKYCAAQKTITATVTTGVGTETAGRSRMLVTYAVPSVAAATKA